MSAPAVPVNPDFAIANRVHCAIEELREAVDAARKQSLEVHLAWHAGFGVVTHAIIKRPL